MVVFDLVIAVHNPYTGQMINLPQKWEFHPIPYYDRYFKKKLKLLRNDNRPTQAGMLWSHDAVLLWQVSVADSPFSSYRSSQEKVTTEPAVKSVLSIEP